MSFVGVALPERPTTSDDLACKTKRLTDHRGSFAVIDVETTGLDPWRDRIIECAIVDVSPTGQIISEWSTLVDVPGNRELGAFQIHGITRSMLLGAPLFAQLLRAIIDRVAGRVIVGHFVSFDLAHLNGEFRRAGYDFPALEPASLCTRELAHRHLPAGSRSLTSCCAAFGVHFPGAHSALGDARATAGLLRHYLRCDSVILPRAVGIGWPQPPPVSVALSTRTT